MEKEILSRLYALRAGVSYLSDSRNETFEDEEKISAYEKAISEENRISEDEFSHVSSRGESVYSGSDVIPDIEDGISGDWGEESTDMFLKVRKAKRDINIIDSYNRDWSESKNGETESVVRDLQKQNAEIARNDKKRKIYKGFAIAFACIVALIEILMLVFYRQTNGAAPVVMVDSLIGGLIIIVIFLLNSNGCKNNIKNCNKRVAEREIFILSRRVQDQDREQKYADALKILEQATAEITALRESVRQTLKQIARQTMPLYTVLKDKYSEIIFEDDWKYLDCIIYEMETGRSDSVRATLQKIDTLNRGAALANFVKQAERNMYDLITDMKYEAKESVVKACEELCREANQNSGSGRNKLNAQSPEDSVEQEKIEANDLMFSFEARVSSGMPEMMEDIRVLKDNY